MKLRVRLTLLPLASLALCGAASAQVTWYVDDDGPGDPFPGVSVPGNPAFSDPAEDGSAAHPYDDIYKAVNVAAHGDTVLVLPSNVIGFYSLTSTLDLQGKAITVRSSGGPLVTAIDGAGIPSSPGVLFNSGEGPGTVLQGFTVQNFDVGSTPGLLGAGVRIISASPTIRDCRFVGNHAYAGAGLYAINSSVRIEDSLFLANLAEHQGGGIYTSSTSPDIIGCTFDSNQANFGAGALFRTDPSNFVEVANGLFIDNDALVGYGGGFGKFDQGDLLLTRCAFVGNTAQGSGSALQVHGRGTVFDCVFNGNSGPIGTVNTDLGGSGGAGTLDVFGCTFTQNMGGSVTETFGTLNLRNSISWNNAPFEIGAGVTVTHSNVLGGWAGAGNIDSDPLFRDVFGDDGIPGTLDDDLSITKLSPCIDAGDTLRVKAVPYPVDFAGAPRAKDDPKTPDTGVASLGLTTDMGAFEYQPPQAGRSTVQQFP